MTVFFTSCAGAVEPWKCLQFMRQAAALLKDVRLIPQWHPVWDLP